MESDVKNLQRFFPEESKACLSRRLFSKEHKAQKDIDQMVTALETSANCQEPDLLARTHTRTHLHTHPHTHTHLPARTPAHTHTNMHLYVPTYMAQSCTY